MFEILQKRNVKSKDLAIAYTKIEKYLTEELQPVRQSAHDLLMKRVRENIPIEGYEKEEKKFKEKVESLNLKYQACKDGLIKLKERMAKELKREAGKKLANAKKQFDQLMIDKEALQRELLATTAKAVVIREKIDGLSGGVINGEFSVSALPTFNINPQLFSNDQQQFYQDQVAKCRSEQRLDFKNTYVGQFDSLHTEINRIEKIVTTDNIEHYVNELIAEAR